MKKLFYLFINIVISLAAGQEALLFGNWLAGDDNETLNFNFTASDVTIHLVDGAEDVSYTALWRLEGTRLIIGLEGEEISYEIVSLTETALVLAGGGLAGELYFEKGIGQARQDSPTPVLEPNPLDQNALAAAFAGLFVGNEVTLELTLTSAGYEGTLTFQGEAYPVQAKLQGDQLAGTFSASGQSYPFEASLSASTLSLHSGGSSYQLDKQAVQVPADTTAAPSAPLASTQELTNTANEISGIWTYLSEEAFLTEKETMYLSPEGRYIIDGSSQVPDYEAELFHEEGSYQFSTSQLILKPYCSYEHRTFDIHLQANQLTLSGQNVIGEPFSYTYMFTGDGQAVVREIEALDTAREHRNQPYLARTPLGAVRPGSFAQAGIPVDPNPTNSYLDATVFSEGELYTFVSEWSYVFDIYGQLQSVNVADIALNTAKMSTLNYSKGTYRDTAQWFFLPNGRFYSLTELYGMATSTAPLTPQTTAFWGKYRINGDTLTIEEDTGTVKDYTLLDGRRGLADGEGTCYKEVTWATEELEQASEQLGN